MDGVTRFIPQSLAARTLAALTVGFAVLFATMVGLHDVLLRKAVEHGTEELLAQRLSTLIDAVAAAPEVDRDQLAHALSRADLTVHWRRNTEPSLEHPSDANWEAVATRAKALSGLTTEVRVRSGRIDRSSDRIAGIGAIARLQDGSWLEVEIASFNVLSTDQAALHSYAAAIGLVLLLAVGFAARSVSAPVSALAATVSRLDLEREIPTLPSSGPREVQMLAEALNGMAARTRDAFRQRTLALGALSHDLMSPIARLRLRAEELPDEIREPIRRDLAEMETMVSDVLAYLRGGHGGEVIQPLVVAALVRTVVDEFTDAGTHVEEGRMDENAVVPVRRIAIKRAVTNLVANAIRHGREPWIEVVEASESVLVRVGDRGPGIPTEDLPRVTEPFFRGDPARTAGRSGSGLGLSTARAIVEAHGGSLSIDSAPGKGTVVTLKLPLKQARTEASAGSKLM
ncbi:HAMP domain-containing protein [Roseomonas sp. KE2513]|uniref:ATP-binding protein n=1 Tax=Roseomonas sp. KE2513 TaxID=2479202 RepID=UPI0018DFE7D0|nr:ATP-binding protein [Roseomonas sp. KE2513]MBI0535213.1 HAMP domain-containing protein [Roseomonas sp. KE2513]